MIQRIFLDAAVFLPEHNTLIISDLHLGHEQALHKQGVLVPKYQYADMEARITQLLAKTKARTLVLNGDIKHEFGTISGLLKDGELFSKKLQYISRGDADDIGPSHQTTCSKSASNSRSP